MFEFKSNAIIRNNPIRTNISLLGLAKYLFIVKFHLVNKELGIRIKTIRTNKKIDLKNVADKVGILDTSFSKIEREGTNSVSTLINIANALGVSPRDFFEDKPKANIKEHKPDYGFATKEDLLVLTNALHALVQQVEKLSERLPKKKSTAKKKYGKK